jgi:hypothetical protein
MISIRKLASALYLAFCFSVCSSNAQQLDVTGQLDPTQVYTTGNIVQPTVAGSNTTPWVNGVYQDNLTCWGWGDSGYCGPNAIVRPGGGINFSYGTTNLYQMQSIANVLPNTGTGLKVDGYNFGFTAKNGNGWDDGRLDYLTAYVSFYDPNGSAVFNKNYDLNFRFNWTTFNYSENFTTPFASKDLGSVQYGFVGRDNNFWAGPYGPEVQGVSFSLKYSVDQCAIDPLWSSSCPGYVDAMLKQLVTTTATAEPLLSPTTAVSVVEQPVVAPIVTAPQTQPTQTTSEVASTSPAATTASPTATSTTAAVASSTPSVSTTASPTANNPQPKVGEVAQSSSPKSTVSTSQILSIISKEQDRLSSVEKTAVESTTQQANQAAATATQQAENVASQAQSQSIATSIQAGQQAQTAAISSSENFASININAPSVVQSNGLQNNSQGQPAGAVGLRAPDIASNTGTQADNQSIANIQNTQQTQFASIQQSVTMPSNTQEMYSLTTTAVVSSVFRPSQEKERESTTVEAVVAASIIDRQLLDDIQKPVLQVETKQTRQQTSTVNQKVKDNDVAGSVSLASISKQPIGFELYSAAMRDGKFYAPKEIYKGQKTVDNVRLLRGLSGGSDRLHQQMVDIQYNLGSQ